MPGADARDLLKSFTTLRTLNVDPMFYRQTILNAILKMVDGIKSFHFYTDEHAKEQGLQEGMGCGHLKSALQSPQEYGPATA